MIVFPNTGIQICHSHPIEREKLEIDIDKLWKLATQEAGTWKGDKVIKLLAEHVSCRDYSKEKSCQQSGWIRCHKPNSSSKIKDDTQDEFIYFRLIGIANDVITLDIVVDTRNGAATQLTNKIGCVINSSKTSMMFWRKKQIELARIDVNKHEDATGKSGSLIIDFGNSATTAIFSGSFTGNGDVIKQTDPFDPNYKIRTDIERSMKRSTLAFLRVPSDPRFEPWMVTGKRADELVRLDPFVTYIYAPKKYIRDWPAHLKAHEPTSIYKGIVGRREIDENGNRKSLFSILNFVKVDIERLLSCLIASIVNPELAYYKNIHYPIIDRIILTYPLVWRSKDRILFQNTVQDAVNKVIRSGNDIYRNREIPVELICSEPVAVAAYLVWENLFNYGPESLKLVSSILGNTQQSDKLRLLISDIGGGSTDIAVIEVAFEQQRNSQVNVYFQMIENIRFNRAGDRITHIIVTSLLEFVIKKYGFKDSLHYAKEPDNPTFTRHYKINAVLELNGLAERAKIHLSEHSSAWTLDKESEEKLVQYFKSAITDGLDNIAETSYQLTHEQLEDWIRKDKQRIETHGESGFMDIFLFLKELQHNLSKKQRQPHLVVLSGRTTRLPFIRKLAIEYTGMPPHRVRPLSELLPATQEYPKQQEMDKLSVVIGAHRFRFGDNVHFIPLAEENIFNRYIGTVRETPGGLILNEIIVQPGEIPPCSKSLVVHPTSDLRIGHAFRKEGVAQVIAKLANNSTRQEEVTIDIEDDFTIKLNKARNVVLSEWIPGGDDMIVDNFNDTGEIDPDGFISKYIIL